jgi:hypothetical protein
MGVVREVEADQQGMLKSEKAKSKHSANKRIQLTAKSAARSSLCFLRRLMRDVSAEQAPREKRGIEVRLTIKLPDTLPNDKIARLISNIEDTCAKEGVFVEIDKHEVEKEDSWNKLDLSAISVDTGIDDFAENHDHYLYGLPRQP